MVDKYREYLSRWRSLFGDGIVGDYAYYRGEKRIPHTVKLMSRETAERRIKELEALNSDFYKALENRDDEGMDEALRKAFEHELELLL